jgi:Transcription factor WhiB
MLHAADSVSTITERRPVDMLDDTDIPAPALCAPRDGLPATPAHVARWFPTRYYNGSRLTPEAEAAISVCDQCPREAACLREALERHEDDGIWGGTTPQMRGRLRRRRFAA